MEQSEEDHDTVLAGYMTLLKNALKSLPDDRRGEVKAIAGADPDPVIASMADESSISDAAAPSAGGAVSAVTAAAGKLVGGMWEGRKASGGPGVRGANAAVVGGGQGLVRELVERCLFSLLHERGCLEEDDGEGGMVGGTGRGTDEDEVGVMQYWNYFLAIVFFLYWAPES